MKNIITKPIGDSLGDLASLLFVSASVPSIKTVEIPAPTAASVKATSTASKVTKRPADRRLNAPISATTAKRCRTSIIAHAVKQSSVKSTKSTIRTMSTDVVIYLSFVFSRSLSGTSIGFSPITLAAFATACVAVGLVKNINKEIRINLTVTRLRPA